MKSRTILLAAVVTASLALGGCDRVKSMLGGGKPSGQVIATVDGEEITALELRQELRGFTSRDPKVMKAAEQQALQRIILRKAIVRAAREQKLDKSADYNLQVLRGQEALLTQLYQRKIAGSVAVPSRQEAETYIAGNTDKFANRRLLVVDQLAIPANKIAAERFVPLKSLAEVRALIEAEGVPHQENISVMDTLTVDPRLLSEIAKLPPGEVFILPQGQVLLFNQIVDTRPAPLQGDEAVRVATNILGGERSQKAIARQLELLSADAQKSVSYAEGYAPPKPVAKTGTSAAQSPSPSAGASVSPASVAQTGKS